CHYCNFHFSKQQQLKPNLVAAICKEAFLRKEFNQGVIDTIYFGGGTPSLLSDAELHLILNTLHKYFTVSATAEITLEANPDDINTKKLHEWHQAGINRLSIGIQSFFEEDLQWMNRAHNAKQAKHCIELAQASGFDNLTIDLIYGTPGLTDERWKQNIETALGLGIPHLSCYAARVESTPPLDAMIRKGAKQAVDAYQQSIHFNILTTTLLDAGFEHYEISNFAKPGFRSKHNSSYWQGQPYLGLGPAAHSFDGHLIRQWNISNNPLYINSLEQEIIPFEFETLTTVQRINEYIMTSLRTMEGISLHFLETNWGGERSREVMKAAQTHLDQKNIQLQGQNIILMPQGKFLADGIAADLFVE
ncbi:MAG: radical SAM family heme chaperone HemW, partial [Chitinophagaceae bacterium]|nr:radical SAM family heme chaperone HemW [Chitinophagaceae bacterium]